MLFCNTILTSQHMFSKYVKTLDFLPVFFILSGCYSRVYDFVSPFFIFLCFALRLYLFFYDYIVLHVYLQLSYWMLLVMIIFCFCIFVVLLTIIVAASKNVTKVCILSIQIKCLAFY